MKRVDSATAGRHAVLLPKPPALCDSATTEYKMNWKKSSPAKCKHDSNGLHSRNRPGDVNHRGSSMRKNTPLATTEANSDMEIKPHRLRIPGPQSRRHTPECRMKGPETPR